MPPAYQPGYDPQTMIGTPVNENDTNKNKKGGDDDQPPAGGAAASSGGAPGGGDLDDIQARINALKGL